VREVRVWRIGGVALLSLGVLGGAPPSQEELAPADAEVERLLEGAAPPASALGVEASYFVSLQVDRIASADIRRARLVLRVDLSTFGDGPQRPDRLDVHFGLRFADGRDTLFTRVRRSRREPFEASKTFRIDMVVPRQGVLRAAVVVVDPDSGLSGAAVASPIWADMRPLDPLPTEPVAAGEAAPEPLVVDLGPYAPVGSAAMVATPIEMPAVRLLLPAKEVFVGRLELGALVGVSGVARVRYDIDGETVGEASAEPWSVRYKFDRLGLAHTIEAVALAADGREVGRDVARVNLPGDALWVRVLPPVGEGSGRQVPIRVGVPQGASLRRVSLFLGDREIARAERNGFEVPLPPRAETGSYLRAEAELEDGRIVEDVVSFFDPGYGEQVEVSLIELYPRIVDAEGRPARVGADDLELVVDGERQRVDRVVPADELPLLVGVAIDTSGSMAKLVDPLRAQLADLLASLAPGRDRVFVTRFSERSVLAQPPTTDAALLAKAFAGVPIGGETALYDGIVHGLIQFDRKSTRRALFVLTDGYSTEGRFDGARTVPIARRLAVPIFALVAIEPKRVSLTLADQSSLARLAAASGGEYLRLVRREDLAPKLREMVEGLRAQTLVAFYPRAEASRKRKWHEVELRSKVPEIRVEGALGYFTGEE